MRTLIIGKGQVGQAIYEVVNKSHETFVKDIEPLEVANVEVLHICYPDHKGFDQTTKTYIELYKPKLTIVNSSVAVGTTETCGPNVVYSPVRGRHPKLETDLLLYKKFIFGGNPADRELASRHFEECGVTTFTERSPKDGELLKLLSNIHMGVEIAWRQEVERILNKFDVDSSIFEEWEVSYRLGYLASGDDHLVRPSMRPDPIGGHCILPCTDILQAQFPSKIFEFIKESNEKTKGEK